MIWITGDRGMLGSELRGLLDAGSVPSIGSDREVDIADPVAVASFLERARPDWVVNCAAYTNVDKAEDEPELAHRLNAVGPGNLARACAAAGSRLIHLSTDYVFDGAADRPYRETDPVSPLGVYGRTKAAGEEEVLAAAPDSVVIRTAWLYGRHGRNFVHTVLRLLAEKGGLGVVADQFGSPTWAFDLAGLIAAIAAGRGLAGGIYHFSGEGVASWHEFAVEIARLSGACPEDGLGSAVRPLRTDQYPTRAARPAYSVLDKSKLRSLGFAVPAWRDSLARYFESTRKETTPWNDRSAP